MDIQNLTNETITNTIEKTRCFLEKNRISRTNIVKICFSVEEVLLEYQKKLGKETPLEVIWKKRLGYAKVIIRIRGDSIDPFANVKDNDIPLSYILNEIDYYPSWRYRKGCNIIRFEAAPEQRNQTLILMASAVALGILLGILARNLPGDTCSILCDAYLSPLSSTILGLLGTLATLLIFVSIVAGISGIGDMTTFNHIGKKMLLRFMWFMLIGALLCILVGCLVFPIDQNGAASLDVPALWQMILGIVPTNIIDAFLTGNALQVVFIAIFTGIIMLTLESKVDNMTEWNMMANIIVQKSLQIVIKTMPLVVFVSIFKLTATSNLSDFTTVYKYPLFMIICCFIALAYFILRTAISQHIPVSLLIKKLLPTYLIAITTSSSSAAFASNMETCQKKLGIDDQIVNIGVPLGQTLFKLPMIFSMICGSFCLAEVYGIAITLPKLVTMLLSVYILAIAAPPVPGVGVSCFTLLFTQLGIPVEATSIIIALDILIDRISTSTKLTLAQTELVQLAASLDLLDRDILRKP